MDENKDMPRRCDVNRMHPAELAIRYASLEVEAMEADPLLTDAVDLLQQAREKVAAFVDWQRFRDAKPAAPPASEGEEVQGV